MAYGRISSHKELEVWNRAMDLTEQVYRLSERLPVDERFGLVLQLRRAAVSVPSNIAEGAGRGYPGDFVRFLAISLGSLAELETQLLISERLGMLKSVEIPYGTLVATRQMLIRLSQSLQRPKTI